MSQVRPMKGFRGYVAALVAVVVFPLLWLRALRFADAHRDDVPRARLTVLGAIVASVLLLAVGVGGVLAFRASSMAGIYANLDDRLVLATGEGAYREARDMVVAKTETLVK